MPYIPQERRTELRPPHYTGRPPAGARNTGELNYLISALAADYIRLNGLSYQTISEVRAAMNDASQEFYRRVAVPYEDEKLAQNGDVY